MACRTVLDALRLPMVAAALLLALAGCSDSTSSPGASEPSSQAGPSGGASRESAPAEPRPLSARETWNVSYAQGARIGYGHTVIRRETQAGNEVLRITVVDRLSARQFGRRINVELRYESVETLDGRLLSVQSEVRSGPTTMKTSGRVVGDRLELKTVTAGKEVASSVPWSDEYGGPYAAEAALLRRPMRPGEHRQLTHWVPALNQIATVEMTAKDYESVKLLGGEYRLLRIDGEIRFSNDVRIGETVWCDRSGEALRIRTDAMEGETFRVTKAVALATQDEPQLDLGSSTMVSVDREVSGAHDRKRIRYRVELPGGDPAAVFVSGPSQQVESVDSHTAELTVYALRPGQAGGHPQAAADPPADEHRNANNLIQSDHPKIVAMARQAAGDQTDPWQVACRLERYVRQRMRVTDFSLAMATAAEVAENPVGDCTEHAVLLAALARARGIPARVAVGLVYMQGMRAFGYHMWNEVYIDDRWIPIDATLAKGGIGAGHLKLGHSSLSGASAYLALLPVAQVTGRLKVQVIDAE
jgi:hypothetical protein